MLVKKKIYFWQPAHFTYFQGSPCYWLPYSVGCLWAYAITNPKITDHFELGEFFFKRDPINEVIENLTECDIAVFSCYVWNYQYNRTLAKAVKEKFPNCVVIFGGPQVTKFPEEKKFFEQNPFVDHIVNGEGEVVFSDLLEKLADGEKPDRIMKFSRLTNVQYPSPYSGGVFDDLVKKYPNYTWQAVIETNRGCPYQCTFCDWGSATYSKIIKISQDRVMADIDWFAKNQVYYCFIADANFGILYDRDKAFAERLNYHQQTSGMPKVIIAQWAKNSKERVLDIAKIFFNGFNRGFTMSVQSMEDQVLEAIKRKNMETSDMTKMLALCKERNIPAYTELLIGLPYETKESWKRNHFKLLELGQHNSIDVWTTQTLENSALNSKESIEEHQIKTVEIPKVVTNHSLIDGDVLETERIIISTKYMPTEDIVEGYIFSSLIMHFHYLTGSTYLLSRFLNKYKNVSYEDFYNRLEDHLKQGNLWISEPYFRLKKFMEMLCSGRIEESDHDLKHNAHIAIWLVGVPLLKNPDKVFEELRKVYSNEWCQLPKEMYDQLFDFQKNLVYNATATYPIKSVYDYDFLNYVEKDSVLETNTDAAFEYERKWNSEKQFLEVAYHERRTREVIHTKFRKLNED